MRSGGVTRFAIGSYGTGFVDIALSQGNGWDRDDNANRQGQRPDYGVSEAKDSRTYTMFRPNHAY
jgi:hypothetical protein